VGSLRVDGIDVGLGDAFVYGLQPSARPQSKYFPDLSVFAKFMLILRGVYSEC